MNVSEKAPSFQLPALDGQTFDSSTLAGQPYMLAFMRFGACPFCNLRVRELIRYAEQQEQPLPIVIVYDSQLENMQKFSIRNESPLPILADGDSAIHKLYGVRYSQWAVLLSTLANLPTVISSMLKGSEAEVAGPTNGMPAEFLIDADGVIRDAWYGKGLTDRMPLDRVDQFISEHGDGLAFSI